MLPRVCVCVCDIDKYSVTVHYNAMSKGLAVSQPVNTIRFKKGWVSTPGYIYCFLKTKGRSFEKKLISSLKFDFCFEI